MTLRKNILIFFASAFIFQAKAQYKIEVLDSNTFILNEGVILHKTSFRGLSVVDDETIWISGSRGTIARSIDGGKTFNYTQLKGYEKTDFRDIEAFDDKRAIVMSSGTPAYILKTIDGGQSWKEVYKNTDTAYFLDAMDFWDDKRGMLVGDPINGHFVLLQTNDGGETWQELDTTKTPEAIEGEAVFAASGTSLRCWNKNNFGFVSGGKASRLFLAKRNNGKVDVKHIEITKGLNSQGTFSLTRTFKRPFFLFAGGDYLRDTQVFNINFLAVAKLSRDTLYGNKEIEKTSGYKSCIEVLNDYKGLNSPSIITTGTSGTECAAYNCSFVTCFFNFRMISKEPFHVVRKAKKGKAVFLAGPNGKIGRLVY
jgi:hypothetical protein